MLDGALMEQSIITNVAMLLLVIVPKQKQQNKEGR